MSAPIQPDMLPRRRSRLLTEAPVLYAGSPPTGGVTNWQRPPTPGVNTQTIDPNADLRSQQITPGYDPRLARAGRQADTAASRVAGFSGYTPFQPVGTNDPYTADSRSAVGGGYVAPTNLTGARGYLAGAAGSLPTASAGGVSYGADTTGVRSRLAAALGGLEGPNRSELAAKAYQLQRERDAPTRDLERRGVGQRAAALGRIGAGMTTNDLTGLEASYARSDDEAKRQLALDAAGAELGDKLNISGALQSGFGALSGEDRAAAGLSNEATGLNASISGRRADLLRELSGDEASLARIPREEGESDRAYGVTRSNLLYGQGRGLREEARGERGDLLDSEREGLNANRDVLGDLDTREGRLYDRGRSTRDEYRGERDYETGQSQQALDNRIRQRALEEQLLGGQFGRDTDMASLLARLGYQNDPTGEMGSAAGNYQDQADEGFGGAGDLLQQMLLEQAMQRGTSPTSVLRTPTPQVQNTTQIVQQPPRLRPAPTSFPRAV